ncbi:caspase [Penaeus vannamei]|uniref:Caspase n=1 Tax=Penaeus vannamei TaxID=6689 RepID=A0A423TF92_PENVA|nr:caspase [Penaeus vannamei]
MSKESPSTHSPAVQLSSEATASNDISDKDVGKRRNTKATTGEKSGRTSAEARVETPVAKISPIHVSVKRPRTPLSDENLGDPLEKRARIVTDTANEAQMKSRRVNALIRRNIGTKIAANGLFKRIANHSSLQTIKLEAELFKSVENGDSARVQELIQYTGAAVRRSKTSCTLLHAAASHNQADVVVFLLKLISPNITNEEGQTPAHVAAEKGHTQVLKLLVRDPDFDADKRDDLRNSVKTLLGGHLFKAVLEGNKKEAERLLAVGADPDSHGGKLVDGVLARELGVTTPRLLANALNMESIVTLFDKKASKRCSQTVESKSLPSSALSTVHIKVSTRQFRVRRATVIQGGADVYKMDKEARGFVRILNFSCFKDRSDLNLQQLDYDACIMSDVFDKMGYMCKTHSSLTVQQTKEVLKNIRDGDELTDVGCAIFVISGYGVNGRKILTTDMKFVDTDYILNLFKDSECPQLKNKPKLFIFNLFKSEAITSSRSESPKVVRLADLSKDMACIYSNSIGLDCVPNGKGTSFSWSLCRALADHSAEQELGDLYREFLKEYSKSSPSSSPELRLFGFTKSFSLIHCNLNDIPLGILNLVNHCLIFRSITIMRE